MAWSWNPFKWFSTEPETVETPVPMATEQAPPIGGPYGGKKRKTRRGSKKGGKRGKTGRSKRA